MGVPIDNSARVGLLALAQVSNDLVEIVVMLSGVVIAIAPHLCNDVIFVHLQSPLRVVPRAYKFPGKCIRQQHIWT